MDVLAFLVINLEKEFYFRRSTFYFLINPGKDILCPIVVIPGDTKVKEKYVKHTYIL